MKPVAKAAMVLFAFVCAGCAPDNSSQHLPEDSLLRHVVVTFGADYVSENSIVVYARDPDGKPLNDCGAHFCSDEHGVRIAVISNPSRSPEPHGIRTHEQPPFTWFVAKDGAVSRLGFIEYRPDARNVVWIEPVMGPPLNSMKAEINLSNGHSVRYGYTASGETDHARVYRAVARHLHTVGPSA